MVHRRVPVCGHCCGRPLGVGSHLICLRYASIGWIPKGCIVCFEDGFTVEGHAHPGNIHYHVIAARLGYGDDVLAYSREHDFAHLFIEECLHNRPSQVLWHVAHGSPLSGPESIYEELAAQSFQAWLRANQRPITSGVDWDALKRDALAMLDETEFNLT